MSDMHICGTCGGIEDCRPGCSCAGCVGAARDKLLMLDKEVDLAAIRSQLSTVTRERDRLRAAMAPDAGVLDRVLAPIKEDLKRVTREREDARHDAIDLRRIVRLARDVADEFETDFAKGPDDNVEALRDAVLSALQEKT